MQPVLRSSLSCLFIKLLLSYGIFVLFFKLCTQDGPGTTRTWRETAAKHLTSWWRAETREAGPIKSHKMPWISNKKLQLAWLYFEQKILILILILLDTIGIYWACYSSLKKVIRIQPIKNKDRLSIKQRKKNDKETNKQADTQANTG